MVLRHIPCWKLKYIFMRQFSLLRFRGSPFHSQTSNLCLGGSCWQFPKKIFSLFQFDKHDTNYNKSIVFSSLFPTFLSCKHHRLAIDIIFCGTWNLGHLPSKPAAAAWLWLFSQTLQNGFQAAPGVHLPFLQYLALCSVHLRIKWCAFHFALFTLHFALG